MKVRPVAAKDYKLILELDKKVYPTQNPVTARILNNWYKENPEFCLVYTENNKIVGLCVALPLNTQGWTNLVEGKIAEAELSPKTIFNDKRDREIGIHLYHIEKLDKSIKNFHNICFRDIEKLINSLKIDNKSLKIIGFSSLCVTKDGLRLFSDILNYKESKFKSTEYILEKGSKKILVTTKEDMYKKLKHGYELITRCQMLIKEII
jgi:hypothetical protein